MKDDSEGCKRGCPFQMAPPYEVLSFSSSWNSSSIALDFMCISLKQQSPTFLALGPVSWKTIFPPPGVGGWFGDDSSALHLLWILFLLLLHHLHLRSSGIKSWRLGTPGSSHHGVVFVMAALANEYTEKETTRFRVWPIPRICLN